ncbi:DUF3592 domain-containing protein [Pseudohaliea sp.]|uniref:DUF3592 domain-containing protein n=1 Tax=Pseudohaliea sp. TaxID=2740289 RepID=UPI0032EBBCC7
MRDWIGALAATLFGLGLAVVGGRLVVYDELLENGGETVVAEITASGSVRRSSGGYVDYIRYWFTDPKGRVRSGQSSGYAGQVGETILVRYASRFPGIHRVSGEGAGLGYRWRWVLVAIGLLFLFAGVRWLLLLRAGRDNSGRR